MGDRFDRWRSLVREAASGAAGALGALPAVAAVRSALREIRSRRARIDERQIARAVLRAGTVSAASVRTRHARIEITAELASGRAIRVALLPEQVRFAPRGAKEVWFAVDPPDAAGDTAVRQIAGLVAAQIARALWGPALPPAVDVDEGALVDREGDRLRIDLRTCPAVRAAGAGPIAAMIVEAIAIERIEVDEDGLAVCIALPKWP